MHVDFDPLQVQWATVLATLPLDDATAAQYGGYNIFRGVPYQRGRGLGQVFRHIWRYLVPIGKEIGSAIGRQGLESGNRVLGNVLQGADLKESLATEGRAGLRNLLDKAAQRLDTQSGKGFDFKRYKTGVNATDTTGGKHFSKKNIHRGIASGIGPPNFLPSLSAGGTKKKRKRQSRKEAKSTKKKTQNRKRLRIDALGTY